MKKSIKIISMLLVVILAISLMSTLVFAREPEEEISATGIAGELTGTKSAAQGEVISIGNQIIGIITTVGVVVSVIVLLVLGIKYMMGSASEKAEYKKTMIPYLVGAILIFGASTITKVVVNLASLKTITE